MKTLQRTLSLLMAIAMALSLAAGLEPTAKAEDPNAPYEQTVTLTSFFEIPAPILNEFSEEALHAMYYNQKQQEATNIVIDYLWYAADSAEDSDQKKNTAIATGDIPDFMVVSSSQLALLAKTDLINKDMGAIFDAYANDTLKAWITAEGTAALDSATYNGQVIAIPLVKSSIDGAPFLWMRQDWLDNLGLAVPNTMEELYNVMVAFRDNDPDGNGKNDTVGLALHKNFLSMATGDAIGLFNGFGAHPGQWIEDGNGGLIYGSVAPEVKDALAFLAKLYAEGLIQEDFSVQDDTKTSELTTASVAGIQFGAAWNSVWPLAMTGMNVPEARWIAVPIVGAEGVTAQPQISLSLEGYVVVSSGCEHPEAVIKLLNFWCDAMTADEETYNSYLIEGSDGLMYIPQHWTMLKCFSPTESLDNYYTIKKVVEANDESLLTPSAATMYADVKAYLDGDPSKAGPYAMIGPEGSAYAAMADYYENNMFHINKFTGSQTKTMGRKMSIVTDKVYEYYTKVIMGVSSLDDWDAFVKEVNSLGLKNITAEVNEWYAQK